MFYITYTRNTPQEPPRQLTFEELLRNTNEQQFPTIPARTFYHTIEIRESDMTPSALSTLEWRTAHLISGLMHTLNIPNLMEMDMAQLYSHFRIPKASGGYRPIDAPTPWLKNTQRIIMDTIQNTGYVHAHTAAYAYVKGRTAKDAVERHQRTGHTYYVKTDLSGFFNSCTKEFVKAQLIQIPIFWMLNRTDILNKILHIACLNGALPQGSPLSPWLTNQVMLPIDFKITRFCSQHNITYTRYADDMTFSSNADNLERILNMLNEVLEGTPLCINEDKTRQTKISGRNWQLGLMVNQENKITVGYKKKEIFKSMVHNFLTKPETQTKELAQQIMGLLSYYTMVEPEFFDQLLTKTNQKYNIDLQQLLKTKANQ